MDHPSNVQFMTVVWSLQEKCIFVKVHMLVRRSANSIADELRQGLPAEVTVTTRSFKQRPHIIEVAFRGPAIEHLFDAPSRGGAQEVLGPALIDECQQQPDAKVDTLAEYLLERVATVCNH